MTFTKTKTKIERISIQEVAARLTECGIVALDLASGKLVSHSRFKETELLVICDNTIATGKTFPRHKIGSSTPASAVALFSTLGLQLPDRSDCSITAIPTLSHMVSVPYGKIKTFQRGQLFPGAAAVDMVLFTNFPKELQDKIWEQHIRGTIRSQTITIQAIEYETEHDEAQNIVMDRSTGSRFDYHVTGLKAFRFTESKELTGVALREEICQVLQVTGSSSSGLFCSHTDMIRLEGGPRTELLLADAIDPKIVQGIRYLELDSALMHKDQEEWLLSNILSMTELETLNIRGTESVIYPKPGYAKKWTMDWIRDRVPKEDRPDDLPLFDPVMYLHGVEFVGGPALLLIHEIAPDHELDRIHRMWYTLDFLTRNCNHIPSNIIVNTDYYVIEMNDFDIDSEMVDL